MNGFFSSSSKKNFIARIRNRYILKQIFHLLQENKLLCIIKHNKNLQKILKISKDNYIECSKIIIEIFPKASLNRKTFINIRAKDKNHFQIFFDNDKKKIKRNYLRSSECITKIKINIDYEAKNVYGLFRECNCIEKINFLQFNRSDIKDMSYMFYKCSSLKELNLNNINTKNVTNMRYMFYNCFELEKINLSKFKTNNTTNMEYMFFGCLSLKEIS